jgi:tetratricopeptide (TPR) repeat protein
MDVKSDQYIFTENYSSNFDQIFNTYAQIIHEIAEKLNIDIDEEISEHLSQKTTQNEQAYQYYLKGRYHWKKPDLENLKKAIEYFNLAIDDDPEFSSAYAGLSDCYHFLASFSLERPQKAFYLARENAMRALEIDSSNTLARGSLGICKLLFDWDWSGAENEFKKAIKYPGEHNRSLLWYSILLTIQHKPQQALEVIKEAIEHDSLSVVPRRYLARHYYFNRNFKEAEKHYHKAIALDSTDFLSHTYLALTHIQNNEIDLALKSLQTAYLLTKGQVAGVIAMLGYVYGLTGQSDKAFLRLSELHQLEQMIYVHPVFKSAIYAGLGDWDKVFHWLEKNYEERSEWMIYLDVEPLYDTLRTDPRYTALLQKVGLVN